MPIGTWESGGGDNGAHYMESNYHDNYPAVELRTTHNPVAAREWDSGGGHSRLGGLAGSGGMPAVRPRMAPPLPTNAAVQQMRRHAEEGSANRDGGEAPSRSRFAM